MKLKIKLNKILLIGLLIILLIILYYRSSSQGFRNPKILVLYVFHIYNERVEKFMNKAIFHDPNIDFIVISNNKADFQAPSYVKKIFRDNIGYDFGGWSEGLFTDNLYKKYDYFIFANSSVDGPYLPPNRKKWTDIYIEGLKDNVKLFGSTINTIGNPIEKSHVQSYIFSMDKLTLEYLIHSKIFSTTNYAQTFDDAIEEKEILMSRKIIERGWNIGSLMSYYKNVDFTFKTKKPEEYNITFLDDIMYPQFRNQIWKEHELVFVKGNRVK